MAELDCFEKELQCSGVRFIAGVDEAGRGPLAGPVVAAAVIFLDQDIPEGIDDSKKLTPRTRDRFFDFIMSEDQIIKGIGVIDEKIIDRINIRQASFEAMKSALNQLPISPDFVLVDGFEIPGLPIPQRGIVKGDSLSYSIAAASIVAKVTRDRMMDEYEIKFPGYGFSKHKGYGTRLHLERLQQMGPCPAHRTSFEPVQQMKLFL